MVDDFIAHTEVQTLGDKTTVVRVVLRNGFELVGKFLLRQQGELLRKNSARADLRLKKNQG